MPEKLGQGKQQLVFTPATEEKSWCLPATLFVVGSIAGACYYVEKQNEGVSKFFSNLFSS